MKKLKKLFREFNISYKFIIIFSIVVAVVIGLINSIPFLKGTSFQEPAIGYEVWFIFAIFIISNSKTRMEAVIKTFIFFLISQPLIYLVEVPFNDLGFGLFRYYPFWFKLTLLTIPGAAIAYEIKKDNIISSIVLSVATTYLLSITSVFIQDFIADPPKMLVAIIFCIVSAFLLIFTILDKKHTRILAIICTIIGTILTVYANYSMSHQALPSSICLDDTYTWTLVESEVDVTFENNFITIENIREVEDGDYKIVLTKDNEEVTYIIRVEDDSMDLIENESQLFN